MATAEEGEWFTAGFVVALATMLSNTAHGGGIHAIAVPGIWGRHFCYLEEECPSPCFMQTRRGPGMAVPTCSLLSSAAGGLPVLRLVSGLVGC
jgi:hypothetical protein